MPRGRPKGSFKWTPEKIAGLWQDADAMAEYTGPVNKRLVAKRLKQAFPDKYRYVTEEQLRQLLSKTYLRKLKLDDLDARNAAVLAHLLGETT